MRRGHSLDVVLTLVLFCLFTGSVLIVLMLGVQTYQGVVASMESSYQERTAVQYIATKVSHYSGEDAVSVTQYGDGSALALQEYFDGEAYITYIYTLDGMLMELFCASDVDLEPNAGFSVFPVEGLELELTTPDLLRIACTDDTGTTRVYVGLHNGEGGSQ